MEETNEPTKKKIIPGGIETGRTTTLDANGNIINETISYESISKTKSEKSKDLFESVVKVIGVLAILLPLWLFYLQRNSEFERQKAIMEFDAYTKMSNELHKYNSNFFNYELANKKELERSKDTLLFELIPRSSFFKNDSLLNCIKNIKYDVGLIYYYFKFKEASDSINYNLKLVLDYEKNSFGSGTPLFEVLLKQYDDAKYNYEPFLPKETDKFSLVSNYSKVDSVINEYAGRISNYENKNNSLRTFRESFQWDVSKQEDLKSIRPIDPIGRDMKDSFEKDINKFDSLAVVTNKLVN